MDSSTGLFSTRIYQEEEKKKREKKRKKGEKTV